MHEATIAESILNIVGKKLSVTPEVNAALSVEVVIGEFRNVDLESLQFAFQSLRQFFPGCEHCCLEAQLIQAVAKCQQGHVYRPDFERGFRCAACDGGIQQLQCGEELDVICIRLRSNDRDGAPESDAQTLLQPGSADAVCRSVS